MESNISISRILWFRLLSDLDKRGGRKRESGAFLLAKPGSRKVSDYVIYDDLSPGCFDSGYIVFSGSGYVKLSKICEASGYTVIADVHTHPSTWTGQSKADMDHPMVPQEGHIALIVPSFAKRNRFNLKGVGSYIYLGRDKWSRIERAIELTIL